MKGGKMIPTPLQAQVLWLYALGMDTIDICEALKLSASDVYRHTTEAKRKATAAGLRYVVIRPRVEEPNQSGFSTARQLAKGAGLI
jgi:DNA-binding CsgD family transcriptional regulator